VIPEVDSVLRGPVRARPSSQFAPWRRLARDQRANVAIIFGLALPVVAGAVGVAVDYSSAAMMRSKMQAVADAAAISAAREFQMARSRPEVIVAIAQNYAKGHMPDVTANTTVDANALTVQVVLEKDYEKTLAKVLSSEKIRLRTAATARMSNGLPLCLVGLDTRAPNTISLQKNARLTAPQCLVYSNSLSPTGLVSLDNAVLQAGYTCSAGGKLKSRDANFSPQPMTDCPIIPDPLSSRQAPAVSTCNYMNKVVDGETATLSPGVYCGGLIVTNAAQVTLAAGTFIIKDGPLVVDGGSSFKGTSVSLYMKGAGANLTFEQASIISLSAPKDGLLAGILIFDDPAGTPAAEKSGRHDMPFKAPREHSILSDDARTLLGTIYMPKGRLIIDATKPIADRSAYTVLVVQQLTLYDGPNLYLNTDYSASDVPVPQGLGPYGGKVMLTN
jgi:Flp pilus assembly protein TadG